MDGTLGRSRQLRRLGRRGPNYGMLQGSGVAKGLRDGEMARWRDGEMARWREEGQGRGEHLEGVGQLMELD
jgi:hypothetical protein